MKVVKCNFCGDTWEDDYPDQPGAIIWCGKCERSERKLTRCGYCEYEESDGELIKHCSKCAAINARRNHTPGPWRVDATVALGAYGVWTDYATHPGHDGAGYGSQICSMLPTKRTDKTRDADAKLIAAAPDLLEACQTALAILESGPEYHHEDGEFLRAAIAKARGQ